MTVEQDLDAQLKTISTLTAIVGTNIFPVALPKGVSATAQPWMTYQSVSRTQLYALSGDSYFVRKRVAINVWSASYSDVVNAQKTIWSALSGFQGTFPNGTQIHLVELANAADSFEDSALMYRSSVQLLITYVEQ
jgi:hypothetical protein